MESNNFKDFAIYHGVPEDSFDGLDLSTLPDIDKNSSDFVNFLLLYKWTVETIKAEREQSNKEYIKQLRKLKFWSAFYTVGIYEDAQEEEVDIATLEYVENNENARYWLGGAFESAALGYVLGKHVARDDEKAKYYLKMSNIILNKDNQ